MDSINRKNRRASGAILSREAWETLAATANYRVRDMAKLRQVSDRQLRRETRRWLGRSPQRWLDECRIVAAARLLLSDQTIKEAAFNLGFKQTAHFCRQFKRYHDMTPSEFVSKRTIANPRSAADNTWPSETIVDR